LADKYSYASENMINGRNKSIPENLAANKMISDELMNSVGLYSRTDIDSARFNKFSRFGRVLDPFGKLNDCREYLFFTKPDLHICTVGGISSLNSGSTVKDTSSVYEISGLSAYKKDPSIAFEANGLTLNPQLGGNAYFKYLISSHPETAKQLQYSISNSNPFCNLLSFGVNNYLDIGGSEASTLDNPSTIFGTSYEYLKDSEEADENPSFSLEFVDNKFLDTYHFFKAYSDYHIARKSGLVTPPTPDYYRYKRLHNTMGVYKFIVAEDMETIIYWAYIWGVYPVSCPREAFSDPLFSDGLTFSVNFKGAFVEDMNPAILYQFNQLMLPMIGEYNIDKYLPVVSLYAPDASKDTVAGTDYKMSPIDMINGTLPKAALVDGRIASGQNYYTNSNSRVGYKLRWYA